MVKTKFSLNIWGITNVWFRYLGVIQIRSETGVHMVTLSITEKTLLLALTASERSLLGRPNLSIELNRVTGVSLEPLPDKVRLGFRVTRRTLFGSIAGEWRLGNSKIIVLRGRSGFPALKISLNHPTIDQIWYCGSDVEQIFQLLRTKTSK